MTAPTFSLCVYCGSRPGDNPLFTQAAQATGRWIGACGGQLVYGGGSSGLMGEVARAARAAGAPVIGVIPQALVDKELANHDCTELHIVQTMHERKAIMAERSNAFLALPGGIGTFEELFEVWTWRQLGYHHKPLGLLNVAGYYDGLLSFLRSSTDHGFMHPWQLDLLHTASEHETLLTTLAHAACTDRTSPPLHTVI